MNETAKKWIIVALVVGTLAAARIPFLQFYQDYRQLNEQLPTFANLQSAAIELQRIVDEGRAVDESDARAALEGYFEGGRDCWGNEIVFLTRTEPIFSFLLISPGSDGKLEVEDPRLYFESTPRDIIGHLERDIIFRDGVAISDAGKK